MATLFLGDNTLEFELLTRAVEQILPRFGKGGKALGKVGTNRRGI